MALLLLIFGGVLGWLVLTGRMKGPSTRQIAAMVLSVVGGAIAARGRPLVGGGMAAAGLAWLSLSSKPRAARPAPPPVDTTTRESLELLGLQPGADRAAVIAAHRRLIARTHPDSGGTEALARQINAARDHLLSILPE